MKRLLADWGIALGVALGVVAGAQAVQRWRQPSGQAPPLALAALDGTTTRLEDLRGRTVVVNFWGTWCPPCRDEIPEIAAYAAAHPEVTVLGVAVRSGDAETLRQAAAQLGATYPVLVGDDAVARAWAVDVFPTTFVVDGEGEIRGMRQGALGRHDLAAMVDRLEVHEER